MSQGEGVKASKKELNLTSAEIGDRIGVQKATVDGWTVGKPISAGAMAALNRLLAEKYGTEYQGVRPDKILR